MYTKHAQAPLRFEKAREQGAEQGRVTHNSYLVQKGAFVEINIEDNSYKGNSIFIIKKQNK